MNTNLNWKALLAIASPSKRRLLPLKHPEDEDGVGTTRGRGVGEGDGLGNAVSRISSHLCRLRKKYKTFFSSFSSQKQKKITEPETSRKLRIFNELGKNRFDKFFQQKWLKDGKGWESA